MKVTYLLLFLFYSFNSTTSSAGHIIEQSIEEENKEIAKLFWNIDGDKFKLEVITDEGNGQYIFNGRNFYICGALDLEKRTVINNFKFSDNSFLKKISNGVCQPVSSNFMVRFFLSPSASIMTLDQSDRLNLSLSIPSHTFTNGKSSKECTNFEKTYQIEKKSNNKTSSDLRISEKGCLDSTIDWRGNFSREVQKVTLRQLRSRPMHAIIKEDLKKNKGFIKSAKIAYTLTTEGKKIRGERTLKTKKIENSKIASKTFKIPSNFAVIDRDYLLEQINAAKPQKQIKTKQELNSTCMALSIIMPSFYWAFGQGCTETSVE